MKQVRRYRLRSLVATSLYIGGRAGTWGKLVSKKREAFRRTKKWWKANLSPGWENYYKLELVGNGRRLDPR